MSTHTAGTAGGPAADRGEPKDLSYGLGGIADSWGLLLALGLFMAALGVIMLVWPGATLVVLAVTFAISLLVGGLYHIAGAFAPGMDGGARALEVVIGALSVLAGVLCLRAPLQTLVFLSLLIGAWWLVTGLTGAAGALFGGSRPGRWWSFAGAILSIVAGVFVLAQPGISLLVLKFVLAIWLVAYGAVAIVGAVMLRSRRRSLATAPALPAEPRGLAHA
jgi:uncharacterized membrane protein HdeD (DUF308 family)